MRYVGGKSKLAKDILGFVLEYQGDRTTYIEPFVGGAGSFSVIAPFFEQSFASDVNEDLVLMWDALKSGWIPPSNVDESTYQQLKNESPSALRGFVGFGCSFGGKWFGGYARSEGRNHPAESARNVLKQAPSLRNSTFSHGSYDVLLGKAKGNSLVYCDPPYTSTLGYGVSFNTDQFWNDARQAVQRDAVVLISEYVAPDDFICIWEKDKLVSIDLNNYKASTERLFVHDSQLKESLTSIQKESTVKP